VIEEAETGRFVLRAPRDISPAISCTPCRFLHAAGLQCSR